MLGRYVQNVLRELRDHHGLFVWNGILIDSPIGATVFDDIVCGFVKNVAYELCAEQIFNKLTNHFNK
jgi:hypothetical protein